MTTILVDCDGVLADCVSAYLALLEEMWGIRASKEEVTSHEFGECVCTPEQNEAVWKRIDSTPGFCRGFRELPYAAEGLKHLRGWADRVVCVTSPHVSGTWVTERYEWLFARGFSKYDIVLASDKSLVAGDALIDDYVKNLRGTSALPIAIRQPWNSEWRGAAEDDLLMASVYLQSKLGRGRK